MILHISASNWHEASVRSFEWQVYNAADSIVRWSVPIFVMISGTLFLERDISIERIHKKNIFRMITAFVFWSIIYALVDLKQGVGRKGFCYAIITGHTHMWFLFMIVGLYLIVPLVKKIVESKALTRYFLALAFIFSFIIPQCIKFITFMNEDIGNVINSIVGNVNFHFTLGFICYFVLGYYLSKLEIPKKFRLIIYLLGIIGFVFTIGATSFISIYTNEPQETFYGSFTINVLFESLGVLVFLKYIVGSIHVSEKTRNIVLKLSKYSFGAYLIHALVIEQLNNILRINIGMFNPILSILIITIIVFCFSFTISCICNHIPFLNKYIV